MRKSPVLIRRILIDGFIKTQGGLIAIRAAHYCVMVRVKVIRYFGKPADSTRTRIPLSNWPGTRNKIEQKT
jgi:hypothetical protein